jgi:hypothetical protein
LRNEGRLISENAMQTAMLRFGTLVPFSLVEIQKYKIHKINELIVITDDPQSRWKAETNHPN